MVRHLHLGDTAAERKRNLVRLVRTGRITLGGYRKSRIFGCLACPAGKRMKVENRVFFRHEKEAREAGYRPCSRCLPDAYRKWKRQNGAHAGQ